LSSKPDVLRKLGIPENCELTVPFIIGHPKAKQGNGKRAKPVVLNWAK
jgi:hypothetical protein